MTKETPAVPGRILAVLKLRRQQLPRALKRLSDYLLENAEPAAGMRLSEIAAAAGVGEATVVRLTRLLGFRGFNDFRIALSVELSRRDEEEDEDRDIVSPEVRGDDSPEILCAKATAFALSAMKENRDFLNADTLRQVVRALARAPRVLVFGMGNSGLCAEFLKNKLARIGINAIFESSSHFMYTAAAVLRPGDVAFAISRKGSVYETVKGMKIARGTGATCVCLTHNPSSPLAGIADLALFCGSYETFLQGDSLGTLVAQLHLCEIIYIMLVQDNVQKALKTKQLTVRALDEVISPKG